MATITEIEKLALDLPAAQRAILATHLLRSLPAVVRAGMEFYERVAGPELADAFYSELRRFMLEAAKRPASFSIRDRGLRRANLHRFPYHFLFRVVGDSVRNLVVRHHRRHPSLGIRRR